MLAAQDVSQQRQRVVSFVQNHCVECHSGGDSAGGLDLDSLDLSPAVFDDPQLDTSVLENLHRRVHTRQMPPPDLQRPAESESRKFVSDLQQILAHQQVRFPRVQSVGVLRRLTRREYQNAIGDLLGIQIDAADYLPRDESSHGFDNITVEDLSTTRMSRYVTAAQKISRLAVGRVAEGGNGRTVRLPADRSQEDHVPGLPLGTRGGTIFKHYFPKSGEYEFSIKLTRDRDEKVEGLHRKHQIDVLLDRERRHRFEVKPPPYVQGQNWEQRDFTLVDAHLTVRFHVSAGEHAVGVTFPKISSSLVSQKRQPFDAAFNRHRHPRRTPAIYQVSLVGPFESLAIDDSTTRKRIYGGVQVDPNNQEQSARTILSRLMRLAYRRPVQEVDLQQPLAFFRRHAEAADFDAGLEAALAAVLSNPNFLFKVEIPQPAPGPVAISDVELASRLAFFLWSSIPDEQLLELAQQNRLRDEQNLIDQTRRMLADSRSESLVKNFAAQWLYLRNLDSITPDMRRFPDFDDNLRQSFRQETEHLFREIIQQDRSVLQLIRSNHTWLNQRLAKHYGIGGVVGEHFRLVDLPADSQRGGILRQGSILMVTSYATRTSPTIRGNWILENILGTPAPPPPANVPDLKENQLLESASLRQRLALHRADSACAGCHDLMDPVGFALENFDAVGRWRQFSENLSMDTQGKLPDGTELNSISDLEQGILDRPDVFARTLTEKLVTFALGRATGPLDGPEIRRIVAAAEGEDFRFSSLIRGIVLSKAFRYRED